MCEIKSMIVLKNKIYCPLDLDHHTQMLKELNIEDNKVNPNFVRIEVIPKDNDLFNHNLNNWKINIDQDYKPDWFFIEEYEEKIKIELQKWFEQRFLIDDNFGKIIKEGKWFLKNSTVSDMYNNSTVSRMYGNSTVSRMNSNSTVSEMCGNSTVSEMCGNSTVSKMCGNSTVSRMCGNSTVSEMYGNSTVSRMYGNSTVSRMCGNSTVSEMYDNSTVSEMYDNSTVSEMCDNSTVSRMCDNSMITIPVYSSNSAKSIKFLSDNAIIRVLNKNKPIIYMANKEVELKI